MTRPVVHWEIGGRDAAKLRQFYAELFGWQITGDPDYGLVSPAGGGIGGGIMQTRGDMPPYVTIYVGVDDLDETLVRITKLGGSTLVSPTPVPGVGSFALFADPEGNPVGLLTQEHLPPD
jgi:hypothetical protein